MLPPQTPKTRIIRKQDIQKVFDIKKAVDVVEEAFRFYGEGKVQMPSKVYLTFDKGDLRCMPAYIPDLGMAAIKNVTVHPQNQKLPTVLATITLIDPETGFPIAILDGTYITRLRTGASGGIAAKYLAKKDSKSVGILGTGIQASTQIVALLHLFPGIQKVCIFDLNTHRMEGFGDHIRELGSFEICLCKDIPHLVDEVDILTTLTPSKDFIISEAMVHEGLHINAIGADARGKQELDPKILKRARIVVDDWQQSSHSGEINKAVSAGLIDQKDIAANIGEIVTGKKQGRQNDSDITVFDSTGLAIQDLACAAYVYRELAKDNRLFQKLTEFEF